MSFRRGRQLCLVLSCLALSGPKCNWCNIWKVDWIMVSFWTLATSNLNFHVASITNATALPAATCCSVGCHAHISAPAPAPSQKTSCKKRAISIEVQCKVNFRSRCESCHSAVPQNVTISRQRYWQLNDSSPKKKEEREKRRNSKKKGAENPRETEIEEGTQKPVSRASQLQLIHFGYNGQSIWQIAHNLITICLTNLPATTLSESESESLAETPSYTPISISTTSRQTNERGDLQLIAWSTTLSVNKWQWAWHLDCIVGEGGGGEYGGQLGLCQVYKFLAGNHRMQVLHNGMWVFNQLSVNSRWVSWVSWVCDVCVVARDLRADLQLQ